MRSDCDHQNIKIEELSIVYQMSPSHDSKNNFIWLERYLIMKKCSSEMHQFESTDPL